MERRSGAARGIHGSRQLASADLGCGEPRRAHGTAISLGLLVETSMARKGTRSAIVHSLTDLVRRLGPQDEAFILSFSNDLVF